MFKGIEKHVIIIKNTGSELIEEAIFILKDSRDTDKNDILKECEKILSNEQSRTKKPILKSKKVCIILAVIILLVLVFTVIKVL